jgi:hypothetical protein
LKNSPSHSFVAGHNHHSILFPTVFKEKKCPDFFTFLSDTYKEYALSILRIEMASVASNPIGVPEMIDNSENVAALLFLIALFHQKGDSRTATKLIETLQKYK